jgi:two-component system, NarL family, sensor kinase
LRQFQSRNDIAVEAELADVGKPESQALLYRAARELLTNIGKHAKASTVSVGLTRDGDRVVLTVDDDGRASIRGSWRSTSPTATSG